MPLFHLKSFSCKPDFSNRLNAVTSFGGLPLVRDVLRDLKLTYEMKWLQCKQAGYDDATILEAVLLMLIAGGKHFSDWEIFLADPGFTKLFPALMSVDTIERYLQRLDVVTGEEYHWLNHGPSFSAQSELDLRIHHRNYIVIRKKIKSGNLVEPDQYSYSVIVTNDLSPNTDALIREHRARCGTVEYAHSQIKGQCGMSIMPSGKFNVNAAWFSLGILAHNVIRYMQKNIYPEKYRKMEIQTIRYQLIRVVAKIISRARSVWVQYWKQHQIGHIHLKAQESFWMYSP